MHVCCPRFSFLVLSQKIGWEEGLKWPISYQVVHKPKLNQSVVTWVCQTIDLLLLLSSPVVGASLII